MHKGMVILLSNLNTVMCDVFIKDQNLVPPPIQLSKFDEDEQLIVNN
jgi:hypothetical protein